MSTSHLKQYRSESNSSKHGLQCLLNIPSNFCLTIHQPANFRLKNSTSPFFSLHISKMGRVIALHS